MRSCRLVPLTIVGALLWSAAVEAAPRQTKHAARSAVHSDAAAMLKQDMRKLWTDHVVWTRDYIVAAVGDQPDAQAAANRLMKNQDDLGNAIARYYGAPAGQQLTTLLKQHISIAVDLIKAAKASDKSGQSQADAKWQQNAVEIADFLSKANPNWPRAALVDLMKKHLSTTTDEVVARLSKNWDADVRAFDAVSDHILHMSDALTDGIVKQFPEKVRPRQDDHHVTVGMQGGGSAASGGRSMSLPTQKNLREMLKPMYQFVPSGPPRAICPIVVPNESEKFSWNWWPPTRFSIAMPPWVTPCW